MKKRAKNIFSVLGTISLIFGVAISLPSWINNSYFGFGVSIFLVILGSILLSIAFGE